MDDTMKVEKADIEDIDSLVELRLDYLIEDNGSIDKNDAEIIREALPDYYRTHLNKDLFAYVIWEEKTIVSCAFLLVIEKLLLMKWLEKIPKFISHIYSLFFINFGWVIFAYDDFGELRKAVKNMYGLGGLSFSNGYTAYILLSYGIFLVIAFIAATPYPKELASKLIRKLDEKKEAVSGIVEAVFLLCVMLLSTAFLAIPCNLL